jgi:hypothetical protein
MKTWLSGEYKGQIIVLFAVVLIAVLGFTALAVDGGMIYSDRRAAQNAADGAAMAAGGAAAEYFENHTVRYDTFSCSQTEVLTGMNQALSYAISRATTNNYTIENNLANKNGVEVNCNVVDIGPYRDKYIDIHVMVTSPTTTSFAHLFYSGEIKNTVSSLVRVHPRTNLGFGYAVATMGTDCSTGGVHGTGNVMINTTHGGVFTNSCFDFTNGKVHMTISDPEGSGCRYVTGTPDPAWCEGATMQQSPVTLTPYAVPAPDCGSLPSYGAATGGTINPGNYTTISGNIVMNPGLYCISSGVSYSGNKSLTGTGVTLYFLNNAGFVSGGNSNINLSAPTGDAPPAVRGMLMFTAPGNTGTFVIYGSATSVFQGTIYVPDGNIEAHGGNTVNGMRSQFIAKYVSLNGSAELDISFDGALNYQIPATLNLQQ